MGFGWRYPVVEMACGLWFARAATQLWYLWHINETSSGHLSYSAQDSIASSVPIVGVALLGWLLIGLICTDWEWFRLPDAFTLTGIAVGMFLVCVQAVFLGPTDDQVVLNSAKQLRLSSPGSFVAKGNVFLTGPEALIFGRLAAVCGAALVLLLVRWAYKALRKKEGLGLGDVKLLAMVAGFLGWWPAMLTLFVGVMLAAAYGVALLARGRAGAATRIPFGSFLGIAGLLTAVGGGRGNRVVPGAALTAGFCI